MKNQVKLGLVAGGILAGIASLAPLTTYAATTDTKTSTVTVTVSPVLTLDSATNASLTADSARVVDTTFSAKVTANKGYTISLHTPTSTALKSTTTGVTDTIPTAAALTAGTNGWGIKKKSADNSTTDATGYTALTTSPVQFYKATSGTAAAGATTTFTVGVAIAPTLTAGSYTTNLTVTAATI